MFWKKSWLATIIINNYSRKSDGKESLNGLGINVIVLRICGGKEVSGDRHFFYHCIKVMAG